jgi:putative transposase
MRYNPKTHHRRSIRLRGWDYASVGEYFVTVCTKNRACIFGNIINGEMRFSDEGRIVQECWLGIPDHFPNARVDVFQIMPNHVHGIVRIVENPEPNNPVRTRHAPSVRPGTKQSFGRDVACNVPTENGIWISTISPKTGTLGAIIRSFKSAATKGARDRGLLEGKTLWQSSFYDHIIRDDIDHFFHERYIELNPIMWDLDSENASCDPMSTEELRKRLKERFDLGGAEVDRIVEHDISRRSVRT